MSAAPERGVPRPHDELAGRPSRPARIARRFVPAAVRRRVSWLLFLPSALRLAADVRSFARLATLAARARGAPRPAGPSVRVRQLGGRPLVVRPGTADLWALEHTFLGAYHLPPRALLPQEVRLAWDLGCHIGTTVAQLAHLFPRARIVGVELDEANAVLCRANVAPWSDRCEILHAAVWVPGEPVVAYRPEECTTLGGRVSEGGEAQVQALTLEELLSRSGAERIDFVKMDIEGAERRVLREGTGWAERVACLGVEAHAGYGRDACADDLRALGFDVHLSPTHPQGLFATRAA